VVGFFPFYAMLIQNCVVWFWLCIMLFRNHIVWLRKYTPCRKSESQLLLDFFPFYDMLIQNCALWFQLCVMLFRNHTVWLHQCTKSLWNYFVVTWKYTCHLGSRNKIHTWSGFTTSRVTTETGLPRGLCRELLEVFPYFPSFTYNKVQ
jgi:hypothetical protein